MHNKKPFFSVVLPCYNRASFLKAGISSVLAQEFEDFELLVIDDGSTDKTAEIVFSFTDDRIRYIYQQNKERSCARNRGIDEASGEWICFLDSDDIYLANHLKSMYSAIILNYDFKFFISKSKINVGDNQYHDHPMLVDGPNVFNEIIRKFILINSVCCHHSIFSQFLFDERYSVWEDTHLWLRVLSKYKFYQINEFTNVQNIHNGQSVQLSVAKVNLNHVKMHLAAMSDIYSNFDSLPPDFRKKELVVNIFEKYLMYIYQARVNRQIIIAFKIWWMAFKDFPSRKLYMEFAKILLSSIGLAK